MPRRSSRVTRWSSTAGAPSAEQGVGPDRRGATPVGRGVQATSRGTTPCTQTVEATLQGVALVAHAANGALRGWGPARSGRPPARSLSFLWIESHIGRGGAHRSVENRKQISAGGVLARASAASRSAFRRRPRPAGVEEPTSLVEDPTSLDARQHAAPPAAGGRGGAHRPRRGADLPRRPPTCGAARGRGAWRSRPPSWRIPPPSTPANMRRRPRPAGVEEPTVLVEEQTSLDARQHAAPPAAGGRGGAHLPRRPPTCDGARGRGAWRSPPPSTPANLRWRPRPRGVEEPTVLVEEPTSLDARQPATAPAAGGRGGAHLPRRPPTSGDVRCRGVGYWPPRSSRMPSRGAAPPRTPSRGSRGVPHPPRTPSRGSRGVPHPPHTLSRRRCSVPRPPHTPSRGASQGAASVAHAVEGALQGQRPSCTPSRGRCQVQRPPRRLSRGRHAKIDRPLSEKPPPCVYLCEHDGPLRLPGVLRHAVGGEPAAPVVRRPAAP